MPPSHAPTQIASGLLAGLLAQSALADALIGEHVVELAFAHDYVLPGDGPRPYLLPQTRARFDPAGALRRFDDAGPVRWPDAQAVGHTGNDGVIAWGRWGHGRIEGEGRHGNFDITGGEGVRNALYYVAGVPSDQPPGPEPVNYEILGGGVAPTAGEGAMAAVTLLEQGRLTVTPEGAELHLKLSVPSGQYSIDVQHLELTGTTFRTTEASTVNVEGVFCFAGCAARIEGFLAGPAGERAGLAYHVDVAVLSEDLAGVVAWQRSD